MTKIQACVFDAYGTLFDVHSAVASLAGRIGPAAEPLTNLWRQRQTEYSWTRSLMDRYAGFDVLTRDALRFAMASCAIDDPRLEQDLLDGYRRLSPFPEVRTMLEALRAAGQRLAILSNGTQEMVDAVVRNAGLDALLPDVYSVDDVGVFKPHPSVYRYAAGRLGLEPSRIAFLSSNPWDAAGARAYGFRVFWVNRKRQPGEYGLVPDIAQMASLAELPQLIAEVNGD